jgi:hypothetical protein
MSADDLSAEEEEFFDEEEEEFFDEEEGEDSEYDSDFDGSETTQSHSGFVNSESDEALGGFGIEEDFDSDGNPLETDSEDDDSSDDGSLDDSFDDEDEEDLDDFEYDDDRSGMPIFLREHPELLQKMEELYNKNGGEQPKFDEFKKLMEDLMPGSMDNIHLAHESNDEMEEEDFDDEDSYYTTDDDDVDEIDSDSSSSSSSSSGSRSSKSGNDDEEEEIGNDAALPNAKKKKPNPDNNDDPDDSSEEEDRDFDPDDPDDDSGPSDFDDEDDDDDDEDVKDKGQCRLVRRVVDTLSSRDSISTAVVHKQGADAISAMPYNCMQPCLKSNAIPYASEALLLGTSKMRAIKSIGDKKRRTKTVLDETEKLPFKIYSASVCAETKVVALCGVHDYSTRGGLSEGSANVAVYSLDPEKANDSGVEQQRFGSILGDSPRNEEKQKRFTFLAIENIGLPHDQRHTADGRLIDPVLDLNRAEVAEQANCVRWAPLTTLKHAYIESYEKMKRKAETQKKDMVTFRSEYIKEAKNHFETKRVLLLSSNDGHVYVLQVEPLDEKTLKAKEKERKRKFELETQASIEFTTRLEQFRLNETHRVVKLDAIFVGMQVNCAVAHPSGKYIAVATDSTILPVIGNEVFGYSSYFDAINETLYNSNKTTLRELSVPLPMRCNDTPAPKWETSIDFNIDCFREGANFGFKQIRQILHPASDHAYHFTPLVFNPEDLSIPSGHAPPGLDQETWNDMEEAERIEYKLMGNENTTLQYLEFSVNGKYLAATSDSRKCLAVWRVEQPKEILHPKCFDFPTETRSFRVVHELMINPLVRFHGFHLPLLPVAFAPSNDDILMVCERGCYKEMEAGAHVIDLSQFDENGGFLKARREGFLQNMKDVIDRFVWKEYKLGINDGDVVKMGEEFIKQREEFYVSNCMKILGDIKPDPKWYQNRFERFYVKCLDTHVVPDSPPFDCEEMQPNFVAVPHIDDVLFMLEMTAKVHHNLEIVQDANATSQIASAHRDWRLQTSLIFFEVCIPKPFSRFFDRSHLSESKYAYFNPETVGVTKMNKFFIKKQCIQTISDVFRNKYITGLKAVGPPKSKKYNESYPDVFFVTTQDSLEIFRLERGWSSGTIFRSSNRRLKFLSGRTRKMQYHNEMFPSEFRKAAKTLLLCALRIRTENDNENRTKEQREKANLGDLTNDCVLKIIEALAFPAIDWRDRQSTMRVERETIVLSDGKGEDEKIDLY